MYNHCSLDYLVIDDIIVEVDQIVKYFWGGRHIFDPIYLKLRYESQLTRGNKGHLLISDYIDTQLKKRRNGEGSSLSSKRITEQSSTEKDLLRL